MRPFWVAWRVEWLKFRSAPIVWVATIVMVVIGSLVSIGGYVSATHDPSSPAAAKAKALMQGSGWDGLFSLAAQGGGVVLGGGAGIVLAWCLGREFTEQTIVGLFAQPVPRGGIALAKMVLTLAWALGVSVVVACAVLAGGAAMGLPVADGIAPALRLVAIGLLGSLGMVPAAWVASLARGYLPGIGAVLGITVAAQFTTAFGGGAWVPWVAPTLWAGATGHAAAAQVSVLQLLLPVAIGLVSMAATLRWWEHAELGNSRG
ncbi:MAG TPA: ABC transporter permease subunit [Intrasporangiaceae bacterium]|nr:ABC transporter permease subunit [Intrasporangiaceae bacterium]